MKIKKLDLFDFKKQVDTNTPFVVKFKSNDCHLCVKLKPHYKKVAKMFPEIPFYDVDVNDEEELADLFIDDGVPTLYYVKGKYFKELEYPNEGYTTENLSDIIQKESTKEEK